jgi:hypothetical protein
MWKSIIDIIKQANVNKFENFLVSTISIHEYDLVELSKNNTTVIRIIIAALAVSMLIASLIWPY